MESKIEKYISDCTRNCSNELCSVEDRYGKIIISYREWLTPDQALRATEIAEEEIIEKAVEWIKAYIHYNDFGGNMEWLVPFADDDEMVENFKKFVED